MTETLPGRAWLIVIGSFVSSVGDRFAAIAFALYAVSIHSTVLVAAVLAAELVPGLLFGLVGGVVTDQYAHAWWWPVALCAQAVCFVALAGTVSPTSIVVFVALSSLVAAMLGPVGAVILREVAGVSGQAAAVRRSAALSGVASVVGTLGAGAAYAIGLPTLMIVNAGSFAVLAVAGWGAAHGVRLGGAPAVPGFRAVLRDATVGFRRLVSADVFGRAGFALVGVVMVGTSLEGVVGVFYFRDRLAMSATVYTVVIAAWSVGMIAGASVPIAPRHAMVAFPISAVAMGAAIAAPAIVPYPLIPLVGFVIGGFGNGVFNSSLGIVIYGRVAAAEQGRAWAAFGLVASVTVLAGYLGGALAGADNARWLMLAAGLLPIVASLVTWLVPARATVAGPTPELA